MNENDWFFFNSQMAKDRDVRFIIGLGDNFYFKGVKSVHDPRFQRTFEDVYNASSLEEATWYMIAGNHDHVFNVSAQIAYTNFSRRWHYPDFYYTTGNITSKINPAWWPLSPSIDLCHGTAAQLKFDQTHE